MIDRAAIILDSLLGGRLFNKAEDLGELRRSGRGIVERHTRFKNAWQPHLDSCKRAQREWATSLSSAARDRLLVLGAGRLLDFETLLLPHRFKTAEDSSFRHVTLIDGDSGCLPTWENFRRDIAEQSLDFEILELTGRIARWDSDLVKKLSGLGQGKMEAKWQAALEEVRGVVTGLSEEVGDVAARLGLRSPTGILSLNILSQLPLAWQRIVERNLYRKFGARFTNSREEEWIESYRFGAEKILLEHLALLCSLKPETIMIISDIEYVYPQDSRKVASLESLRWRSGNLKSDVRSVLKAGSGEYYFSPEVPAAPIVVIDALAGSGIFEPKSMKDRLADFEIDRAESWLWHIVPRKGGDESRTEVHRVAALTLRRKRYENAQ